MDFAISSISLPIFWLFMNAPHKDINHFIKLFFTKNAVMLSFLNDYKNLCCHSYCHLTVITVITQVLEYLTNDSNDGIMTAFSRKNSYCHFQKISD